MHAAGRDRNSTLPVTEAGRSAAEVARQCAAAAREILAPGFPAGGTVARKGRGNIVTEYDLRVEQAVAGILREHFPEHGLLAEETAATTPATGYVWVVDPIDGTRNFASGIPFFCFTLALTFDAAPLLALTLDPLRDETFFAVRGGGLWLNDRPAQASAKRAVRDSVVALDLGYDDGRGKQQLAFAHHIFPGLQSVRIPGCAALGLAYTAVGRYDCFAHPLVYPWDSAAGLLLVHEGGGAVTTRDGRAAGIYDRAILAGGAEVHADLLRLWQEFHPGA